MMRRVLRVATAGQAGAALLAAMLTVSLVATFAAAALWQQWRGIEVEQAERTRVQAAWILVGALDWARLLLREDCKPSCGADHLGEPWAVPLQEARLSTFLSADRGMAGDPGSDAPEAYLSGQIIDLQSLLDLNNLVELPGSVSEAGMTSFGRLFDLLGLPPAQLTLLAEGLSRATRAALAAQPDPGAPLRPQRVEQLAWLGLTAQTVAALQPYVTFIPLVREGRPKAVNLNTASAEVIYAAVDGLTLAEAQRLVNERARTPFRKVDDASKLVPGHNTAFSKDQQVAIASKYFEVRARLRLDPLVVEERSTVYRDSVSGDVSVLSRERGVADGR